MHVLILDKSSPELKTLLKAFLPDFEQEFLPPERLSVATRRQVSLGLARSILFDQYHFSLEETLQTQISRLNSGAPLLITPTDLALNISISHSGSWFSCVISETHEKTCIDLEDKKLSRKWQAVSKRYFSPPEQNYVKEKGIHGFYKIWTTKEALAKLSGKGLERVLNIKMDYDFLKQENEFENSDVIIRHAQTENYYYTLATKK